MITERSGVYRPESYIGLSTDQKPEDAANGSTFIEMNTSKLYFYNAEGQTWLLWDGSTGGGAVVGTAVVGTATV